MDFQSIALPGVRSLTPYQPGKPIEELERELGLTDIVKLASNENPLGPGPLAREAMAAAMREIERYPDGSGHVLRMALARELNLDPARITLGNGSNELLELVARTFVTPDDEVVFSQHSFVVYPIVTQAIGARAVEVPAREYGHDLAAMADACGERTRLVFIANPNNPTGTWNGRQALRKLLETVPGHTLVVVDEAYFEYVDHPQYPNALDWIDEFDNLVVTRTFSKVHGLAALRVGFAVSNLQIADLINRVRQPFNVNTLGMVAAAKALEDKAHVSASKALNHRGLRLLEEGARKLGLSFIPSIGNFLTVEMPGPAGDFYEALLRQGVIVRPIAGYGLPNHLRVSVGLESENERFVSALEKVLV